MAQATRRSRSVLMILSGVVVGAFVFGWLDIPLVSSEGMIIRSHLIEGKLPTQPEDPAWETIPPFTVPLSGQVFTRPVWPDPTAQAQIGRAHV